MPTVEVFDGNIEAAISSFKNRVNAAGIINDFKKAQQFSSESQRRRWAKRRHEKRKAENERRRNGR